MAARSSRRRVSASSTLRHRSPAGGGRRAGRLRGTTRRISDDGRGRRSSAATSARCRRATRRCADERRARAEGDVPDLGVVVVERDRERRPRRPARAGTGRVCVPRGAHSRTPRCRKSSIWAISARAGSRRRRRPAPPAGPSAPSARRCAISSDVVRRHGQGHEATPTRPSAGRDVERHGVDAVARRSGGSASARTEVVPSPKSQAWSGDPVARGVVRQIEESNGLTCGRLRRLDHEARDRSRMDRPLRSPSAVIGRILVPPAKPALTRGSSVSCAARFRGRTVVSLVTNANDRDAHARPARGPDRRCSRASRAARSSARSSPFLLLARERRRPARRADRRAVGRDAAAVGAGVRPELRLAARGRCSARTRSRRAPPGYRLRIDARSIDARRFERLVREARAMPTRERATALREALELWRGTPLSDLAYWSFAQDAIRNLEEQRVNALQMRLEAELELGPPSRGDRRARCARARAPDARAAALAADARAAPLRPAHGRARRLPGGRGSRSSRSRGWSPARSSGRCSVGSCRTTRR